MGSEERQRDWLDSLNHPDLIESCRALVAPRERKYEPLLGPATTIYYIYLGRCRESQEWNGIPDIREMQALSPIPTHPSLRVEQRKRKRKREPKQCAVVQLATLAHGYRGNRKKAEHDASRRISRTYFAGTCLSFSPHEGSTQQPSIHHFTCCIFSLHPISTRCTY